MKTITDVRYENFLRILNNEVGSLQEMADIMKRSHSQISQLNTRVKNIGNQQARNIEIAFEKPNGWMDTDHSIDGVEGVESTNISKIPLITWEYIYTLTDSNFTVQSDKVIKYMEFSYNLSNKSFALAVKGDAMLPEFPEGTILAVDPNLKAVNGNFVIARNSINEYTFRKYISDSGASYLKPLNSDFPIELIESDAIIGVVVETKRILV